MKKKVLFALLGFLLAAGFLVVPALGADAQGSAIVVNSRGDGPDTSPGDGRCAAADGSCTLRAAITTANGNRGPDRIEFAIPGGGVSTIVLGAPLPPVDDSTGPVVIDGYTQPGSSPNTDALRSNARIMIELQGPVGRSLAAITIRTPANEVRGLAAYGADNEILITGENADGNRVVGNFLGTNAAGTFQNKIVGDGSVKPVGIKLESGASQNVVGTPAPADRNVISGNAGYGVKINHGNTYQNVIQNNIVGLNPQVTAALGHVSGIDLQWSTWGNLIGGSGAGEGNLVGASSQVGIEFSHDAQRSQAIGNRIGTLPDGNSVAAFTANTYGIGFKDGPSENYVAGNIIGGSKYGVWSKHNYNPSNVIVNNRIGVGADGAAIANTVGVSVDGVDNLVQNNLIGNSKTREIEVTNSLGDASYFRVDTYTHSNRISQNQFRPAGVERKQNLALGGTTSQSSISYRGDPARAIDGNKDGSRGDLSSHTANEAQPWWEVDLGRIVPVSRVDIYGRTDCCSNRLSNFSVMVSNTPMQGRTFDQLSNDPAVTRVHVDALNPGATKGVAIPASGRYVRVQLEGTNYLSLAEVRVVAVDEVPVIDNPDFYTPNGNDIGDADTGVQDGLNHPTVTGAGPGKVFGQACAGCTVEVYTSGRVMPDGSLEPASSVTGEGLAWIGTITADGAGRWSLGDSRLRAGRTVSALAIDSIGNTSELLPGYVIPRAPLGVGGTAGASRPAQPVPPMPDAPPPYESSFNASVGGKVADLAGSGVAGVKVDLFNADRTGWLFSTTTAADGGYAFLVEAGCYTVTMTATDGAEFATGKWYTQSVCADAGPANGTLLVGGQGAATVQARVVDRDGNPVSGVATDLFLGDAAGNRLTYERSGSTDASGLVDYSLTEAGCRVVTFQLPAGDTFVDNGSRWLNQSGCPAQGETVVLTATIDRSASGATIEGRVVDGASGVAGVNVDVFTSAADGSRGTYRSSTSTDGDGRFSTGVGSGCWVLTYSAPDGRVFADSGTGWLNRSVCAAAGETASQPDVILG